MKTPHARLIAAFAVIYLVWGSTYLAIRIALEAWPPFLLAGTRFLLAGVLVLALARKNGAPWPTGRQWAGSALTGALLFLAGNGLVCWAEQAVASGVAALAIATVPVWMTLIPAPAAPGAPRAATGSTWLGVVVGLSAVAVLALPSGGLDGRVPTWPLLALLLAAASWAAGSHLTLRLPHPGMPLATSGTQMLCGGAWATLAGSLAGEWGAVDAQAFSASSIGAWLYLVVPGSVLAVSAYGWLLRHASPAAVGTYAFVNPIVAVLLGWGLAGESLGPRTLASLAMVVVSVLLILRGRRKSREAGPRRGLRAAAAALALAFLLPSAAEAASPPCCTPSTASPALRLRDASSTWREKEQLAATADARDPAVLLALAETAWDEREDWRVRLTALAACWQTPRGQRVLRAYQSLRGPLLIETPNRILVLGASRPRRVVSL